MEGKDPRIRERSAALLKPRGSVSDELFASYVQALEQPRDPARGRQVFVEKCAACHQAHGVGQAVGPDLNAEFQRAEETIIRDVLAPSDTISAGYVAYAVLTSAGGVFTGLLLSESPTSITLRQAEGKEQIVLRKAVSMMPDDLSKLVSPADLADLLSWLPPADEHGRRLSGTVKAVCITLDDLLHQSSKGAALKRVVFECCL